MSVTINIGVSKEEQEWLQELANEEFGGNISLAVKYLMRKGVKYDTKITELKLQRILDILG